MTASIATPPKLQFFDANGVPLSGGKLYTYAAGTTTPLASYTDESGATPNTNPIILDSRGEASVWLGTDEYKIKLTNSSDVEVWTVDNLNGPNVATLAMLAASGGSALIGYIATGSGVSARTVQSKLRDTVSVLDFGADSTGAVDSSNAFQNAINAIPTSAQWGGVLLIPPGTYLLNSTLTINKDIVISGYGARINSYGARCFDIGDAAYLTNLSAGYYKVLLAGMFICHYGANEIIRNQGIRRVVLLQVMTQGGTHAFYSEGAWENSIIDNCRFLTTTSHCINLAQRNNLFTIKNTAVLAAAGYGLHLNTAGAELKGVKLWGVDFEGNAGAVFIGGNTGNVMLDGCWFESNTVFNVKVDNTAGTNNKYAISLYNCQITGAGVDVLIGTDATGTLVSGVEVSACEFVNSNLIVIGGDKVTEFVEFANRKSGTTVFTFPTAPLAGPIGSMAVRYGAAPTEPFGYTASGVQGDVRYGSGRLWVKNADGWIMLQGAAVNDYSSTMQSLPTGATPSVSNLRWAATNNAGATNVTNLLNGYVGQEIILWGADGGNTTIQHGADIRLSGGTNFTLGTDDTIHLLRTNTKWVEVARSNNV